MRSSLFLPLAQGHTRTQQILINSLFCSKCWKEMTLKHRWMWFSIFEVSTFTNLQSNKKTSLKTWENWLIICVVNLFFQRSFLAASSFFCILHFNHFYTLWYVKKNISISILVLVSSISKMRFSIYNWNELLLKLSKLEKSGI